MLFYRNHRFYWEGVSFALPDNLYIQTDPELLEENTLNLWTQDKRIHITIGIEEKTKGPEAELQYVISELQTIPKSGPEAIDMGGLHGFWAWHYSTSVDYAEYRLHLDGEGTHQTEVLLLFSSKEKMSDLEDVKKWVKFFDIRKENESTQ